MFPRIFSPKPKAVPLPLFTFGTLQLSDKVRWLDSHGLIDTLRYLHCHLCGDWGELGNDERCANDAALQSKGILTSRYQLNPRLALVIVTNEDRSLTTIQLPGERAVT